MIITKLPHNLTYEQFKALAIREPDLTGDWIYELEETEFYAEDIAQLYPEFYLYSPIRYFFRSLEDAERHMCENLLKPSIYRFVITQRPVGSPAYEHGAQWLYDHNGNLIDRTTTRWDFSGGVESLFFGRPPEGIRFKKGDIVEVAEKDRVYLAVIGSEHLPLEWYWKKYSHLRETYFFDASDEMSHYLLDGPGYRHHSHANTINLMSCRWPVPDDIRRYFEYSLECANEEDCYEVYQTDYFTRYSVGEIGNENIGIIYDSSTHHHRLVYIQYDEFKESDGKETETILPGMLDKAKIERLTRWLNKVMHGRPRLWYIIRHWNTHCRDSDSEPVLSLNTPIEELLK